MRKLLDEIRFDLGYLKTHTLQPQWFKVLKIFILLGVFIGYYCWFGMKATILFFISFIFFGLVLHLTYRIKTNRFTTSWLDFIVTTENNELRTERIGKYYYSAVILITILSILISQVLS